MRAYRLSVNLKLGLIVFAVLIALVSLAYSTHLVNRLRERERASVRILASAYRHLVSTANRDNPYEAELMALDQYLAQGNAGGGAALPMQPGPVQRRALREAIAWALSMPNSDLINFVTDEIIFPNDFGVPAIVVDSATGTPFFSENVLEEAGSLTAEDTLRLIRRSREMADVFPPIRIVLGDGSEQQIQYLYYDESNLVKELRLYPYLQLLFVGLFILVGYLGFSYVRRSEQSSLWVGMAREAAHQLGTPISSLMGWTEVLKSGDLGPEAQATAVEEIEKDIERLGRVTSRFNDIGSLPKLEPKQLAPMIGHTADYMRRRFPQYGKHVTLDVEVPGDLRAPLNTELFEWVIENLLKNALDAIEKDKGRIAISAHQENGRIFIDVRDNGKGIDRRQWKNIFRPGYSTKTRGWGLGLSLAKRIVEDYHGGTITLAHSKVGQGTTFRIELPQA